MPRFIALLFLLSTLVACSSTPPTFTHKASEVKQASLRHYTLEEIFVEENDAVLPIPVAQTSVTKARRTAALSARSHRKYDPNARHP